MDFLTALKNPTEAVHVAPSQIALALDLSTETVNRWLVSGELEGRRFGRTWRVSVASLERFLSAHPVHALRRRVKK